MAKMKGAIEVNTERCKGCSLCMPSEGHRPCQQS